MSAPDDMTSRHAPHPSAPNRMSALDRRRRGSYLRRFVPAITAYVVIIAVLAATTDDATPHLWAWYLVPMAPLIWVGHALYRDVRAADEYQRSRQLQAMSVGFAASMLAALVLGLLGAAGVVTGLAGWIVFGAGMAGWASTSAVLADADRAPRDAR